jgi:hypothetical protein
MRNFLEKLGILKKKSSYQKVNELLNKTIDILNEENVNNVDFAKFKANLKKIRESNCKELYISKKVSYVKEYLWNIKNNEKFKKYFDNLQKGVKSRFEEEKKDNFNLFETERKVGNNIFIHSFSIFEKIGEFVKYSSKNGEKESKVILNKFLEGSFDNVSFEKKTGDYIIEKNKEFLYFNMYRNVNQNSKNITFIYYIDKDKKMYEIKDIMENIDIFSNIFDKIINYLKG